MNYGGFWIRFLAYVVDSLIVGIGFFLIVMGLGVMGLELFSPEIIFLVMSILYWALMQSSARQATYGKSLVGLKVTGPAGERLSVARSLAREVAKILSTLTLLIGYIIAGFTKNKQALHDFIASSYVVRAAPGQVVVALAVAVVALLAPFAVVFMLGAGLVAGMLGGVAGAMLSEPQITAQAPEPPARPAKPPAPPIAKPQPVQAAAPATKPAAVPVSAPAPAPMVVAQAKEPAKPMAAGPPKEAPPPKPVARKPVPKPVAEPAPMAEPAPKPMAEPAPKPMAEAPRAAPAGPTTPGPRFNDLVTAVLYRDAKAVEDLLAFGKWPDKADSRGMTPLMLAATLGDAPIAEALLKAGANPNRPGPGGETAMSIARERKDAGMIGLLQRHGAR